MATDKINLFYLDDILLETDPKGWDDITFEVKLDKELNGRLISIDADLEFFGDGYTYLSNKLYEDGFCETVNLKIMEACADSNYRLIHEGVIFLSRVLIEEKTCGARVKPSDNSFYAKISNNKGLNVLPWVEQSKNGVEIEPALLEKIGFFNPVDGVYYPHTLVADDYTSTGYRAFEIFKYLVAWMTDGTVDFGSTLFDTGGELEFFMLTTGTVLFTVQSGLNQVAFEESFPDDLSFENFFKEVYKKEAIGFYIDYSGLRPKLWIEKIQEIPTGTDAVTLDNIKFGIKTTVDTQRLYSTVNIGSSTIQDVVSLEFPEGIDWLGFKEESYNVLGNCGVDTTLDLVSDYIISSNVIQDAVVTPSDAYEGQFAFIECYQFTSNANIATQTNNLTGANPPYFYNQGLTNNEVAKRFFGAIPVSIAKFLGNNDNTFFATMTDNRAEVGVAQGTIIDYGPLVFQDDFNSPNFDTSNNWNAGVPPTANAGTFICPQTGIYTFSISLIISARSNEQFSSGFPAIVSALFNVYDAADNFIVEYPVVGATGTHPIGELIQFTVSASIYLTAGYKLRPYIRWENTFVTNTLEFFRVLLNSTFACTSDVTGGGIYATYDPKDYLGLLHEFEYNISASQWAAILANPRGNIKFAQANQDFRRGLIDTIRFNKTGISQVKLIRSINT